ncbi:MAG: class I SAM-dependent methyltransferase [Armatimonadota bacterium]
MINYLHARVCRPEKGWDPVPAQYAIEYASRAWSSLDESIVMELDEKIGGLEGKQVLDLGAGAGQYSVAFAKRGASVTWYDVSRNYLQIAQQKSKEARVDITFSLGYMDEAPQILRKQFDLVFNRGCFSYGWSDASFVSVIYKLVRPGGYAYIETNNSSFGGDRLSPAIRFRVWLNAAMGIKIGHPHPPRGRIPAFLLRYPLRQMIVDYSEPYVDRIFIQKAEQGQ